MNKTSDFIKLRKSENSKYMWRKHNINSTKNMHLASEVSSTTNNGSSDTGPSVLTMHNGNNGNNSNGSNTKSTNNNVSSALTAETLAERTLDSLMAEHPGELVRTGSPHIVRLLS